MPATTDRSSPLVLQVFGDLADADVAGFRQLIDGHRDQPHVVVDLSEVTSLCQPVVATLTDAIRTARAADRTLVLRAGPGTAGELALSGTDLPYESASRLSPTDRWRASAV